MPRSELAGDSDQGDPGAAAGLGGGVVAGVGLSRRRATWGASPTTWRTARGASSEAMRSSSTAISAWQSPSVRRRITDISSPSSHCLPARVQRLTPTGMPSSGSWPGFGSWPRCEAAPATLAGAARAAVLAPRLVPATPRPDSPNATRPAAQCFGDGSLGSMKPVRSWRRCQRPKPSRPSARPVVLSANRNEWCITHEADAPLAAHSTLWGYRTRLGRAGAAPGAKRRSERPSGSSADSGSRPTTSRSSWPCPGLSSTRD